MSKTYFLAPTRDTPPTGPIFLGSIVKSPRSPELSLNGKKSAQLKTLEIYETSLKDSSRQLFKDGKGKTGIWSEFLNGIGIGAEISGNWDNIDVATYKFDELITRTIAPDSEQVNAIFSEESIQKAIKDSRFRSNLYMITGIKVARGADVAVSKIRSRGGNLHLGVDLTPFAVPIQIGPDISASKSIGQSYDEKHTDDFVFAYRLREIRYRKKAVVDQKEFDKGDLMGHGQKKEEAQDADGESFAELIGLDSVDVDGDAIDAEMVAAVDEEGDQVTCIQLDEDM